MNVSVLASIAASSGFVLGVAALIAAFTGALIAIVVMAVRQQRGCMATWRSYAGSRGARFIESEGPWYHRQGPRIRSQRDGVEFAIERFVDNTGESGTTHTRIQASCPRAGRTNLTLRHNGFGVRIERSMGMRFNEIGDAHFDARFAVRCKTGGAIGEILDPLTRERLLQIDKRFSLSIKDGSATLQWPGWEVDAAVLDSAAAAMVALCRPHRPAMAKVGR